MHREHAMPHSRHMLLPEDVRLIVKKKKKKESIAKKWLKPSQMKMFLKSNQWSIELTMHQASHFMVFRTFEETLLLLLDLKVRTLIFGQIWLVSWCDQSFEEGWRRRDMVRPQMMGFPPYEFHCGIAVKIQNKYRALLVPDNWARYDICKTI